MSLACSQVRPRDAQLGDHLEVDVEGQLRVQARAHEVFEHIVAHAPGPEVVIVSHGGTIRMLLLRLFEGAPELKHFHVENTSLTTIERNGDRWQLHELAVVPHL